MIERLQRRRLLLLLVVSASMYCCATGTVAQEGDEEKEPEEYELTLKSPTLEESIGQGVAAPSLQKFVQIEVTKVDNKELVPLTFSVSFRPAKGEPVELGVFSLFPPDNPGIFIVATRGLLESGGTVTVTLVPLQDVTEEQEIRIWVKPLEYLGESPE